MAATMQVEDYRLGHPVGDLAVDEEAQRRMNLVAMLGFNNGHQLVDETSVEAARYYPQLTGRDLRMWTLFHYTMYSRKAGDWVRYRFDRVPTDVLEAISTADALEIFDDIEIWTPEINGIFLPGGLRSWHVIDPMAVGVIGLRDDNRREHRYNMNARSVGSAKFFPIVRWGESLEAAAEIVRKVILDRTSYYNPIKSLEDIPEPVLTYIQERLLTTRDTSHEVYLVRNPFRRHCGKRIYGVNRARVCGVCGQVVEK